MVDSRRRKKPGSVAGSVLGVPCNLRCRSGPRRLLCHHECHLHGSGSFIHAFGCKVHPQNSRHLAQSQAGLDRGQPPACFGQPSARPHHASPSHQALFQQLARPLAGSVTGLWLAFSRLPWGGRPERGNLRQQQRPSRDHHRTVGINSAVCRVSELCHLTLRTWRCSSSRQGHIISPDMRATLSLAVWCLSSHTGQFSWGALPMHRNQHVSCTRQPPFSLGPRQAASLPTTTGKAQSRLHPPGQPVQAFAQVPQCRLRAPCVLVQQPQVGLLVHPLGAAPYVVQDARRPSQLAPDGSRCPRVFRSGIGRSGPSSGGTPAHAPRRASPRACHTLGSATTHAQSWMRQRVRRIVPIHFACWCPFKHLGCIRALDKFLLHEYTIPCEVNPVIAIPLEN